MKVDTLASQLGVWVFTSFHLALFVGQGLEAHFLLGLIGWVVRVHHVHRTLG